MIFVTFRAGTRKASRKAAIDLASTAPEAILVITPIAARMVAEATRAIPVVFLLSNDPVAEGLVSSVARPGGNVTGFTQSEFSLGGKWLQLLKEMAPGLNRVAAITNQRMGSHPDGYIRSIEVSVAHVEIRNETEIESLITGLRQANTGLIFPPDSFTAAHRATVLRLAARNQFPAIFFARFFVLDGGLISYGIDQPDLFRQAAGYVDRVLRGTKPEDLPVQSPKKFDLAINLKTAKALGLDIPPTLLARADEVIE
jgi:putative tryptophan/tyrosine transport system substrate-binding protein